MTTTGLFFRENGETEEKYFCDVFRSIIKV